MRCALLFYSGKRSSVVRRSAEEAERDYGRRGDESATSTTGTTTASR